MATEIASLDSMRDMFSPITADRAQAASEFSRARIGWLGNRVVEVLDSSRQGPMWRSFDWEDLATRALELKAQTGKQSDNEFAMVAFRLNQLYDESNERINQSWLDWTLVCLRERVLSIVWPEYQTAQLRNQLETLRQEALT